MKILIVTSVFTEEFLARAATLSWGGLLNYLLSDEPAEDRLVRVTRVAIGNGFVPDRLAYNAMRTQPMLVTSAVGLRHIMGHGQVEFECMPAPASHAVVPDPADVATPPFVSTPGLYTLQDVRNARLHISLIAAATDKVKHHEQRLAEFGGEVHRLTVERLREGLRQLEASSPSVIHHQSD